MDITELKLFLGEDGSHKDGVIKNLYKSAKAELSLSGVPEYTKDDPEYPVYEICTFLIVSRDYDKRPLDPQEQKTLDKNILRIKAFPVDEEEADADAPSTEQPGEIL